MIDKNPEQNLCFDDLFDEIIGEIYKRLDPISAITFARVSTKYRQLAISNLTLQMDNLCVDNAGIPFLRYRRNFEVSTSLFEAVVSHQLEGHRGDGFFERVNNLREDTACFISHNFNILKPFQDEDCSNIDQYPDFITQGADNNLQIEILAVALMKLLKCRILIQGIKGTATRHYDKNLTQLGKLICLQYKVSDNRSLFYHLEFLPTLNRLPPILGDLGYHQARYFSAAYDSFRGHYAKKYNDSIADLLLRRLITTTGLKRFEIQIPSYPLLMYSKRITKKFKNTILTIAKQADLTFDDIVNLFLDKQVIVSQANPFTIMAFYARKNNVHVLNKLFNLEEFKLAVKHCYNGQSMIECLLSQKDLDSAPNEDLIEPKTLQQLINNGLRINILEQTTPLSIVAVSYANLGLVDVLLLNGARDYESNDGNSIKSKIFSIWAGSEWNYYVNELKIFLADYSLEGFLAQIQLYAGEDWDLFLRRQLDPLELLEVEIKKIVTESANIFLRQNLTKCKNIVYSLQSYRQRLRHLMEINARLDQPVDHAAHHDYQIVNAASEVGKRTELHWACRSYDEDAIVKLLLLTGVDFDVTNEADQSPLMELICSDQANMVSIFNWRSMLDENVYNYFCNFLCAYWHVWKVKTDAKILDLSIASGGLITAFGQVATSSVEHWHAIFGLIKFLKMMSFRDVADHFSAPYKTYFDNLKLQLAESNADVIKVVLGKLYESDIDFKKFFAYFKQVYNQAFFCESYDQIISGDLLESLREDRNFLDNTILSCLDRLGNSIFKTKFEVCLDLILSRDLSFKRNERYQEAVFYTTITSLKFYKLGYLFSKGLKIPESFFDYLNDREVNFFIVQSTLELYCQFKDYPFSLFHFICQGSEKRLDNVENILIKLANYNRIMEKVSEDPVECLDNSNETPLFYAIRNQSPSRALELIYLGSDLTHRNDHGQTVLDLEIDAENMQEVLGIIRRIIAHNNIFHSVLNQIYAHINGESFLSRFISSSFFQIKFNEDVANSVSFISLFLKLPCDNNFNQKCRDLENLLSYYFEDSSAGGRPFFYEYDNEALWNQLLTQLTKYIIKLNYVNEDVSNLLRLLLVLDDPASFEDRLRSLNIDAETKATFLRSVYDYSNSYNC